jgi:protein JSN1
LITWLLDTSNLPGRYRLLAPRFSPHLSHLCTHKLASAAVLKIINQRVDPQASRMLLDVLFAPESKTLEDILGELSFSHAACSYRR